MVEYFKKFRLGRLNYFGLLCLIYIYVPVPLSLAFAKLDASQATIAAMLNGLMALSLIPYLLISLLRVQDTGKHRAFTILAAVLPPLYLFWPGSKGENQYNVGPKALPLIIKFLPLGVVLWFIFAPYIMLATNA
jgi:hypothetical protein